MRSGRPNRRSHPQGEFLTPKSPKTLTLSQAKVSALPMGMRRSSAGSKRPSKIAQRIIPANLTSRSGNVGRATVLLASTAKMPGVAAFVPVDGCGEAIALLCTIRVLLIDGDALEGAGQGGEVID